MVAARLRSLTTVSATRARSSSVFDGRGHLRQFLAHGCGGSLQTDLQFAVTDAGRQHLQRLAINLPRQEGRGRTAVPHLPGDPPDYVTHQHCANIDARIPQAENAADSSCRVIQQLRPARAVPFMHHMPADWAEGRRQQIGDAVDAIAQILVGLFRAGDRGLVVFDAFQLYTSIICRVLWLVFRLVFFFSQSSIVIGTKTISGHISARCQC